MRVRVEQGSQIRIPDHAYYMVERDIYVLCNKDHADLAKKCGKIVVSGADGYRYNREKGRKEMMRFLDQSLRRFPGRPKAKRGKVDKRFRPPNSNSTKAAPKFAHRNKG